MDRTGSGLPRRLGILLALVPVLAVGLADAVIAVRMANPQHSSTSARSHVSVHGRPADQADARRMTALHDLLKRRAAAVLHPHRRAFLATVDPAQPKFRTEQAREYAAISVVPLA